MIKQSIRITFIGLLMFSLGFSTVFALPYGQDLDGNGLWDDLDEIVVQAPPFLRGVAHSMAMNLQEFTLTPVGNISLGVQAMTGAQHDMMCMMSIIGQEASKFPMAMRGQIILHSERAEKFSKNERAIAGQQIVFDENPATWGQYCPPNISIPTPNIAPPSY